MSFWYLSQVMSRAVDGRVKVVFLATALPLLKVVTVTFATGVFFAAVVEVLRVLRFFGVVAFGVAGVFDLTVINSLLRVYSLMITKKGLTKTPL